MSGWIIDVCSTCGRRAVWPFCEHRDQRRDDGRSWCEPVNVVPTTMRGQELAAMYADRELRRIAGEVTAEVFGEGA